jgi:hypothetical protein
VVSLPGAVLAGQRDLGIGEVERCAHGLDGGRQHLVCIQRGTEPVAEGGQRRQRVAPVAVHQPVHVALQPAAGAGEQHRRDGGRDGRYEAGAGPRTE